MPQREDGFENWASSRRQRVQWLLQTWKRIRESIDPKWKKETIYWNLAPPPETEMSSGVAPEEIEDPELRAEYEAAIRENERKARENNRQIHARKQALLFLPRAKQFLITAYSHQPRDVEELERLLLDYVVDEKVRMEILSQVRAAAPDSR